MIVNNTLLCDENRKIITFLRAELEISSQTLYPVHHKIVGRLGPSATEIDFICFRRRQSLRISAMPRPSLQYPVVCRLVRRRSTYI